MSHKYLACAATAAAVTLTLQAAAPAAEQVDTPLTDTSQIRTATNNPFFGSGLTQNLAGVNFHYSADANGGGINGVVPSGATVNGVGFDNIDMVGANPPTGPFTLTANAPGVTLTQNMPWAGVDNSNRNQTADLTGPDDATAEMVTNEMFYIGPVTCCHPSASLTFSGLGANAPLYVQVIGGDQGWAGNLGVTANGASVGVWDTVADGQTNTASIYGFDATADAGGNLTVDFAISGDPDPANLGNFAGISGLTITGQVPEPAGLGALVLGAAGLLRRRRRVA